MWHREVTGAGGVVLLHCGFAKLQRGFKGRASQRVTTIGQSNERQSLLDEFHIKVGDDKNTTYTFVFLVFFSQGVL